jgi:hypothetical protein
MGQSITILEAVAIGLVTIVLYALVKTLIQTCGRNADTHSKN